MFSKGVHPLRSSQTAAVRDTNRIHLNEEIEMKQTKEGNTKTQEIGKYVLVVSYNGPECALKQGGCHSDRMLRGESPATKGVGQVEHRKQSALQVLNTKKK